MSRRRKKARKSRRKVQAEPASSLVAQVDWAGGEIRGKATNISLKGLFIEAEEAIDVDEPVMVEFSVIVGEKPRAVIASGHVVRCFDAKDTISGRIRSGLGLRFELILAGKTSLKAFIRERARSASTALNMRVERRAQDRIDASLPVAWRPRSGDWRHGYLLRLHGSAEFVIETPRWSPPIRSWISASSCRSRAISRGSRPRRGWPA